MDFSTISVEEWLQNEEENLQALLRKETWHKIPLINVNEVHNFKDGTLVRFRGMIQDMFGPEYYLEMFHVVNELTNDVSIKRGKYRDGAVSGDGERIDFDHGGNVTSERQSYVVTTVPGINEWVIEQETEKFKVHVPHDRSSLNKRNIDEVMTDETENEPSRKAKNSPKITHNKSQKPPIISPESIMNHPLADKQSKVCHIRVYKNADVLKLNDTCDFVGFLSIGPEVEPMDEDLENQMEFETHHPPSSLVPKIHIVHFEHLLHINPLLIDNDKIDCNNFTTIKKELLIVLTQVLMGDTLAAEYLICNLISEVYLRRDFMPLGKFTLNISNVPHFQTVDYIHEIYKLLQSLVPKSHYLPLSLENLNTLSFTPKKDYECNRLTSGLLQLSKNTLVLLDETKLQEGKIEDAGVQGLKSLVNAIKNQKVTYDFNYYPLEYDCDISFVTFSEGKSMLPSDVHVLLNPDESCVNTVIEIFEAAKHFLKLELLNDIRKYLTEARLIKYEISDEVQSMIQEEFVTMRQSSKITADDLHALLVLARLLSISEGKNTLDAECWRKACSMEEERRRRNAPVQKEKFALEYSDTEEDNFKASNNDKLLTDTDEESSEGCTRKNSVICNQSVEILASTTNYSKLENDQDTLSCYHSASHTENFSTDEHDSLRDAQETPKLLHISDSGTDLTEFPNDIEVHNLEADWLKFWSINGERLIWQSWITKYSAYINPSYLGQGRTPESSGSGSSNQAVLVTNNSGPSSSYFNFDEQSVKSLQDTSNRPEYPTKVLTRLLSLSDEKISVDISEGWNPLSPLSIDCETEVERLISSRCGSHTSSRSLRTVDSMTNVTRMTVSSLDIGSSASSDSISSVSSVSSSESSEAGEEEYETRWNELWKDHYEQEYIFHYNKFFVDNQQENSSNDTKLDSVSAVKTIMSKLKVADDQSEKLDFGHEDNTAVLMENMGLPTSFESSKQKKSHRVQAVKSDNLEKTKQQLKAFFDLVGVEHIGDKTSQTTGILNYKMKHIRHQNRLLTFGNNPNHIRFDDDGNAIEDNQGSADNNVVEAEQEDVNKLEEEATQIQNDAADYNVISVELEKKYVQKLSKRKKRKRKINYPPEMETNSKLRKFWPRRFSLFSKFDEGIKLDAESWYSVTPEIIAKHAAQRCASNVIVDAFCGAGGNAIQFAFTCNRVIAIDIDPNKIELAKSNADVYGVSDKIDFILGDFFVLAQSLKADAVFLSPPWGGIAYKTTKVYDLETMLQPTAFSKLYATAKHVSDNIAAFLPKNSDIATLIKMAGPGGKVEIEQDFINNKQIAISAYYNGLINDP